MTKFKKGDQVYREVPDQFDWNKGWSYKKAGPYKIMAEVEGYLMVRRPRAMPFVLSKKDAIPESEITHDPR